MTKLISKNKLENEYGILMIVSFLMFMVLIYMLTGKNCFTLNTYQTYAFQAESWTHGRLDLEENYSWLEIAEYNGKFYCSFPPFPSYVLFPFAFIFGHETPDALILLVFDIAALIFLYKIALHFKQRPDIAMLSSLFITICSNFVFDIFDPAVWFFAQSICFSVTVMAIYFALMNKGGLSLFLWACAVGCRPMMVVFLPVFLMILYKNEKSEHPEDDFAVIIKRRIKWCIPTIIIAVSYMLLNYLRFDSITEFGHNYLPEFVIEHKQFSLDYLAKNLKMLMHIPSFDENGKMVIDHFGNMNFLMVNTPVVFMIVCTIIAAVKKHKEELINNLLIILMMVGYLLFVMCHATMGGWHFGNRYSNEILPFAFLGMMYVFKKNPGIAKWQIPFAVWGICINIVGTIIVYNGL